ncbi:MAG TPA: hypothetical protein VLR93_08280 [Patescibacteria group bacterium]|nr:hypothetical protein [Patescibacteria group bacterium]
MAEALRPMPLGGVADRRTVHASDKAATAARTVEVRRPVHLAVAVGLSAGAYAAALAGVTALQSTADRDLAAARRPTSEAANHLAAEHDRIGERLTRAVATYDAAAAAYDDVSTRLGRLENGLHELAIQVKAVEGSAAWVAPPATARLPAVSRSARSASTPPTSNGSSGASGH